MNDFTLKNLTEQLEADSDGAYRQQLIDLLNRHKNKLITSKQQLLEPAEYSRLEHLERTLDAALKVLSQYRPFKRKDNGSQKEGIFDSIFDL